MEIRLSTPTNIGGMPTFEYTIYLDGIALQMKKEDFQHLLNELQKQIGNDYSKANELYDKYWKEKEDVWNFVKELRKCFYTTGDDEEESSSDWFFKRDKSELDIDKIHEVLDSKSEILGFN